LDRKLSLPLRSEAASKVAVLTPERTALRTAIGRGGFFSLAFGAMVGSGWVVILGDWLTSAGPGGATLGFVAGALVMIWIAQCYGELAARSGTAGGEFLFTLETFGRFPAFLVGWLLTLYTVAVCAFEAVALAWMLRAVAPSIALPVAYRVGTSVVTWDALLVGLVGTLAIAALHVRGAGSAIRFQNALTYGFIGVSVCLILVGLCTGSARNLEPLLVVPPSGSWLVGTGWVFATCAYFLNGWQAAIHAIEERRAALSAGDIVACVTRAIAAAALFYCGIVLAAASIIPWQRLTTLELPAAAAFRAAGMHGILGTVVLVTAVISLAKTWSAMTWMSSRLILAQARCGLLPTSLANVDSRSGVPRRAILISSSLTLLGVALGRAAILPIVDMVSICLALSIVLSLIILLRRRRLSAARPAYCVPGGTPAVVGALLGTLAMVGMALAQPLLAAHGHIPPEWLMLGCWTTLGILVWYIRGAIERCRARRAA
jgi:basic amino acid/polyamine antiporter, APA family